MDEHDELVELLTQIRERLDRTEGRLDRIELAVNLAREGLPIPPPADLHRGGGEVARDEDLDGPYGNPEVRRDPPRWMRRETYVGRRFSDCPAEYLDATADFFEWKATKADEKNERVKSGKPKSFYCLLDAARARGWAERARQKAGPSKHRTVVLGPARSTEEDDDIPF